MKLWIQFVGIFISMSFLFSKDNLKQSITEIGFENIYTETKNNISIIVYENRLYRSELTAMSNLLNIINQSSDVGSELRLVPMNRGIPIASVELNKKSDSWELTEVSLSPDYLSNSPENTSFSFFPVSENWRENSSFGKWELSLVPDVRANFHTPDGFVKLKLNAITEASITLGRGLKFYTQLMIPILYQYDKEIAELKSGSSYLNYTTRFKNNTWLSISSGIFHWKSSNYRDELTDTFLGMQEWYRYGISVQAVKYFSGGRFKLFFNADQTGHLSYKSSKWYYSSLSDRFTWFSGIGYRFDYPNVYAEIGYGQDLYKDMPLEIKLVRSFGEIDLGFYGVWNESDALETYSGGASISIPIPYFYVNRKNLVVSSAKRFNWFIWYHSGFGGRYPKANNSIDEYQKRLLPSHIKNNTHLFEGAH